MPTATVQLFTGPDKPLRQRDLALPDRLEPDEVLVALDLATICGSDLHTLSGLRREPPPLVLGHEAGGHPLAASLVG